VCSRLDEVIFRAAQAGGVWMVNVKTINDAFLDVCGRGEKRLWLWFDAKEDIEVAVQWKPITSAEA
jgi:hypothetical protein